jgi:hypothetical protein
MKETISILVTETGQELIEILMMIQINKPSKVCEHYLKYYLKSDCISMRVLFSTVSPTNAGIKS